MESASERPFRIGLVLALDGPAGLFAPSCELVTDLAVAEVNRAGGVRGRRAELELFDCCDHTLPGLLRQRLREGRLDAVTGWHISAVRRTLTRVIPKSTPYAYTSLYEGDEFADGVHCVGEVPTLQLLPAVRWLRDQVGLRSWCIVGSDYVWPRRTAQKTHGFAGELGLELRDEFFVPYGRFDAEVAVRRVVASGAQAVLMLLVGQDAVEFNRAFARAGVQAAITRFTPLMEENMLLASGADATENLYVAAAYFKSLATQGAIDLMNHYVAAFGADAPPLNNAAESCYEGVLSLAALMGSADAGPRGFDGPRGPMSPHGDHFDQDVYLARAEGFDFEVLTRLTGACGRT